MTNPNTHGGAIHHDHGAAVFVAARLAGLIMGGCLYCGWIAAVTHVSDWMSRCPDAQAGRPAMITLTVITGILGGLAGPVIWWLTTLVVWRMTGHLWCDRERARQIVDDHQAHVGGIDTRAMRDVGVLVGVTQRERDAIVRTELDDEASLAIKDAALRAGWRIDEEWGGRCGFVSGASRIFLRFRCADAPPEMKPAAVDYAMFDAGDGGGSRHLVHERMSVAEQVSIIVEHLERYAAAGSRRTVT